MQVMQTNSHSEIRCETRQRLWGRFRHLSMWAQLTLIMSCIILCAFGIIIYSSSVRQAGTFMEEYTASAQTILDMEIANLEQYIRDLRSFCVQPCLNVTMYNSLLKTSELTAEEIETIQQEIQAEYHSRTDLLSYSITAVNQALCFERPLGGQHVTVSAAEQITDTDAFRNCGASSKYEYLAPSGRDDTFFQYYHYLIRIRDRAPVSISCISVNTTQLELILDNHRKYNEILCLYNTLGELLYSNLPALGDAGPGDQKELLEAAQNGSSITIDNTAYLVTHASSQETGMILISMLPQNVFAQQSNALLKPLVIQAILITSLLIVIVTIIIRMITVPLTRLSDQMSRMGEGDFSSFSSKSGCRETEALTASYNDMAQHIDRLIETNYISSINEKNSRLRALEAQLNPHFLYNTLQAIATEALLADHGEIYDMIVSLSENLRYTIKGDELVYLQDEMNYVNNYILLQKTRLGDRLSVETVIDPQTGQIYIPKISIQMLVENAIIHGMPGNNASLHITIRSVWSESTLHISVYDDGRGIPPEKAEALNRLFSESNHPQSETGSIGLPNLASRLRILYQGKASLTLYSEENRFTEVRMIIPQCDTGGKHV